MLGKRHTPLMPCHPARARALLKKGKAVIHRRFPFVLRLKHRTAGATQPIQLKLDPGSKHTGVALASAKRVLALIQINHRSAQISKKLKQRSGYRRRRRTVNLRCRPARFLNRTKPKGWLPPSTCSVVNNITNWITRLRRWYPVTVLVVETVKFDLQQLQNPEIEGVEYQRGTLHGFEVWEYLLEKGRHQCAYCDAKHLPLTKDHVLARIHGGSNRISNLVLACLPCNQRKGSLPVAEFLKADPNRLKRILAALKRPLQSAAAMNAMRNGLLRDLCSTGLPVEVSRGAVTKFNRTRFGIPKSHALDAACTGTMEAAPHGWAIPTLVITATGRGSHQRTTPDRFGFPRLQRPRTKRVHGFQTGDTVRAVVPKGVKAGTYEGRVAVRTRGTFKLQTNQDSIQDISYKHCRLLTRADGYHYSTQAAPKGGSSTPLF